MGKWMVSSTASGVDGTVAVNPPQPKSAIEQIADAVDELNEDA